MPAATTTHLIVKWRVGGGAGGGGGLSSPLHRFSYLSVGTYTGYGVPYIRNRKKSEDDDEDSMKN